MRFEPFVISPPFGNYLRLPFANSVVGSFTNKARPGWWGRAFKTLRRHGDGFVNEIGLRNPGIEAGVRSHRSRTIVSVAKIHENDLDDMLEHLYLASAVEINAGCRNVNGAEVTRRDLKLYKDFLCFTPIILKLPAKGAEPLIDMALEVGIDHFHACNTIPTGRGSLSGPELQKYSLPMIERIRRLAPDSTIIGGGGIYEWADVRRYRFVGADICSLSTICLQPVRFAKLLAKIAME